MSGARYPFDVRRFPGCMSFAEMDEAARRAREARAWLDGRYVGSLGLGPHLNDREPGSPEFAEWLLGWERGFSEFSAAEFDKRLGLRAFHPDLEITQ